MTIDDLEDGIQIVGPDGYAMVLQEGDRWLIAFEDGTDVYAENMSLVLWKNVE